MGQLGEFLLECFTTTKNTSFYSVFGRNRPIVSIDGYDEMVHRGSFQLSRSRPISIDSPDDPHGLAL